MTEQALRELLESVRTGRQTIDEAVARLRAMPFEDLGFAKVDHHRSLRCGFPEVIYCEGKSTAQVTEIFAACARSGVNVIATRARREVYDAVAKTHAKAEYNGGEKRAGQSRTAAVWGQQDKAAIAAVTIAGVVGHCDSTRTIAQMESYMKRSAFHAPQEPVVFPVSYGMGWFEKTDRT